MTDTFDHLTAALADRYAIERELGAGGMATVYLAEDLKHKRKVAVKVLRPELAAVLGAERFVQEIETTANLQHPHILPLFDSGEADGFLYYVMPYIEGETLRDKLNRETQLGIDEAVKITTDVADALDYAHRQNVIHRDIKPENILLHDGRPMVADFGIALAVSAAAGGRMTETGLSLGTPHYMSPEQATAEKDLTARSDQYSLASVLYEMLTGHPPHVGASAQQIIMKIVTEEAQPITTLRKSVPPNVAAATAKALEKLPADRFESAVKFAEALGNEAYGGEHVTQAGVGTNAPLRQRAIATHPVVLALAGLAVVLGVVALRGWTRTPPQPVSRFEITLERFVGGLALAVSPDGALIVYPVDPAGLALRARDELEPTLIPGVESAWTPAFSPDGSRIAYATGFPGALRYVTLSGGAPVTILSDSVQGQGLAWSDDGWIYFAGGAPGELSLYRVPDEGGVPELVVKPDPMQDELFYTSPAVLDGGGALFITIWRPTAPPDIGVVDLASRDVSVLTSGTRALYAASGHLIIARSDGTIAAVPFDAKRLELRGTPTVVESGVRTATLDVTPVSLSREGTLLYEQEPEPMEIVRVDRDGRETVIDPEWSGHFYGLGLSPLGDRLAFSVRQGSRSELWVKELDDGPAARLASIGRYAYRPTWTPDGSSVLFISDFGGLPALYTVPADGSGPPEILLSSPRAIDEGVLHRDGAWLIYREGSGSAREIYARRTQGDTTSIDLLDTGAEEYSPVLSPNGRWLAYGSTESGADEVYVRPFPDAGSARSQISGGGGGTAPLWSHSGRELFYRNGSDELVAVTISEQPSFRVVSERVLFSTVDYVSDSRHRRYAVSPDDQSFIFARQHGGQTSRAVVVLNWFEELRARVGR